MTMTDPIADMLTRIRNALRNRSEHVDVPASKLKAGVLEVLKREGYISDFKSAEEGAFRLIRVYLKYGPQGEDIINKLVRVSKPGCRVYKGADELPPVLDGLGVSVVSTPKGVLSDRECRKSKVGGEVICSVW